MRIVLGNRHAVVVTPTEGDGGPGAEPTKTRLPRGKRATVVDLPDYISLLEAFTNVAHPSQGVWAFHAVDGATPAWVAGDSPALTSLLAEHFGGIEVRDLADPYGGDDS